METRDAAEVIGARVGSVLAGATRPLFWGLLVGGTDLAVLPAGPMWSVAAAAAVVIRASSSPRDRRLSDLSDRSKFLRLAVVTALAGAAPALGIEPSAFLVGAVLFLASKTLRGRPANVAVVAGALGVLLLAGYVQHPQLLPTGEAWSAGGAARDLLRFLMLLVLLFGARDDERRVAEVEQARESAVRDERLRISRELHDVVAHHVSAMTIQAEAARSALPSGAERADAALVAAAREGRTAMTELRSLLGVLRGPTGETELGPQPDLEDLDELVAELRRDGLDVRFHRTTAGEDEPHYSPALRLSAFRIVQEALANVRKHAAATVVDVRITTDADAMIVEVIDDGRGTASFRGRTAGVTPGYGILGMQERAALLGGTVEATPRTDGPGWKVRAVLPLSPVRGMA